MNQTEHEPCVRVRKEIFGENYYLTIGREFVHFTVPRENDPAMSRERAVLEGLSETINEVRKTL